MQQDTRERIEEHKRPHGDDARGEAEPAELLSRADGQAVFEQAGVGPDDERKPQHDAHHTDGEAAHTRTLVDARRPHELDKPDLVQRAQVKDEHHDEHEREADEGEEGRLGREAKAEVGDRLVEEGCRHKHQDLREEHTHGEPHQKRGDRREERLEHEDQRDLTLPHTQQLVEAKLPLATLDQVVVGIDHEEAQNEGQKHRDEAHEHRDGLHHLARVLREEVRLSGDGVERVEHRHAQHERDEVDRVVAQRLAYVAQGQPKEHRTAHPPSSRRPP